MLTLDTFWSTVFKFALSSVIAWSLTRLWQIACVIVFRAMCIAQPTWEESQNTALIVNNKAALEGFVDASGLLISRRKLPGVTKRANLTLITLVVAALGVFGVTVSYPYLAALIPMTNYGLIVSKGCG